MKQRWFWIGSLLIFAFFPSLTQAQSLWNSTTGNWFTPGNWTPTGVPDTNIKAQINNGGTAQITTAGANANTLNLGNGIGESGNLSVSGAGTLTINGTTGFTMAVGEAGTGTVTISGGGTVSPPVLYIGHLTGSVGMVTVTGTGSLLNATFDIEVGASGQGTLKVLAGGTATTSVLNVGNGTGSGTVLVDGTTGVTTTLTTTGTNVGGFSLGSTGQVTITGAKASFTGGGVDVGSAGDGTLTLSAGATGRSTSLLIGDDGTGTVTLTGTGTTHALTGSTAKVTVGNTSAGNLNIEAGATLSSLNGVIGQNSGGVGILTITGAGSSWTITGSNTLLVGASAGTGGTGTINVLNGGKLSAANLNAFTSATIKVDGAGSQILLPNDFPANKSFYLGSSGTNKLDVTGGGTLATGSAILTTTAGSSLAVTLSGMGSNWTLTEFITTLNTQFGGAGTATFLVSNGASLNYAQDGFFNVDATGTGTASLTVSSGGSFSTGTTSGTLRIGQDHVGSLMIDSGGIVNTAHSYVGEDTGALGTATLSGLGSQWHAGDLNVGILGGNGTVTVSGGASLTGAGSIGGNASGSGQVTVSGTGTSWIANPSSSTNNFVFVGTNGTLTVQTGASLTAFLLSVTGNGSIIFQNTGTQIQNNSGFTSRGTGTLQILNGAVVNGAGASLALAEGDNNVVTVDGAGSKWTMTGSMDLGANGGATLNIQNGAQATNTNVYLGSNSNPDHSGGMGIAIVTGTGSKWTDNGFLRVGDLGVSGALTISAGGTMTSVSGVGINNATIIGNAASATGTLMVTGIGSSWANTGDVYIGRTGTGTLTTTAGGTVSITGIATLNATSTLNIGTGAVAGAFSAASVVNNGLIHFNHTGTVMYSSPTSGTGAVTKDGGGTTIITGTQTYTGATTVNAGLFQVDGTLGNTAVSVASGAILSGKGSIGGTVTIQNGGILAPGDSPGTLTMGSLLLNGMSELNFELATPGVVGMNVNDLIEVTGDLTLDGTLNVTGLAGFTAGIYRLIDYGGILTDHTLSLGITPAGNLYSIVTNTPGQINLAVDSASLSYWDGPNLLPNAVDGGTGIWNNGLPNWTTASGASNGPWDSSKVGIFSSTAGTVTLGDNITFAGLQFTTDGYIINQDAGHLFSLSPGTAAPITVDMNVTATINAPLTGPGGINKQGLGTLVLTGAHTYSGGTAISTGTLQLGTASTQGSIIGTVNNHGLFNIINADTTAITSITNAPGGTAQFGSGTSASSISITNQSAAAAAGLPGKTSFMGTSTAGSAQIQNNGASVAGAGGGTTTFSGTASAGSATITNNGGIVSGFAGGGSAVNGGITSFGSGTTAGNATITNNPGTVAGADGGLTQFNAGSTSGTATITNVGAAVSGVEGGQTQFNGNLAGAAHITNQGGTVSGAFGGNTGVSSGRLDGLVIINEAGTVNGAVGGATGIFDPISADGGTITNNGASVAGALGGSTVIASNAFPANFNITNNGGSVNGGEGGTTAFANDGTTAANSVLVNNGGTANNAGGGLLQFLDGSTAGTSTITNYAGTVSGAHGGSTEFQSIASAGTSNITVNGGTVSGALGGSVLFSDMATAGHATLIINGGTVSGAARGFVQFHNTATAGNGTFTINGGMVNATSGGVVEFFDTATAGSGIFTTGAGTVNGAQGGFAEFFNTSTAGSGTFNNNGAGVNGALGGNTEFNDSASAGAGAFNNKGGTVAGANGGLTQFYNSSTAGSASLVNSGGTNGGGGGTTYFHDTATAGSATITNNADDGNAGAGGFVYFLNSSSAGSATINNNGGTVSGAAAGHAEFTDTSTAATATINNFAGTGGGGNGYTNFLGGSSAASATINNNGGTTSFFPGSTAGNAFINNTSGGTTVFRSTAANATITSAANSGTYFYTNNQATGSARFIFNSPTAFLDISGSFPNVTVGSIEGNGTVNLGSKELIVGANNLSTTFSGVIKDGGQYGGVKGALTKVGVGTLALAGVNTYTGDTNINGGVLFVDGSLASANVRVNAGGTLGGNGIILGNVLNSGVVSPGHSPGTLHIGGSYTQASSGTLVIEVASASLFDKLTIDGHASLDGTLRVVRLNNFQPQVGDRLVFLTAGGGVSGTFHTVNNDFNGLGTLVVLNVKYGSDNVALVGEQNSFANAFGIVSNGKKPSGSTGSASLGSAGSNPFGFKRPEGTPAGQDVFSVFGITPNQIAVALALDSALFDPRQAKVLQVLDGMDINLVPHQLDKIAPEELTSIYTLGFAQLDSEVLSLQQRLGDIRSTRRAAQQPAPSEEVRRAQAADKEPVSIPVPTEDHYGFFLTQTGDFANQGDTTNANGFNIQSAGTTLGVDVTLNEHWVLGLMLGYARTNSDLIDDGSLRVDGGKAALYAMYTNGGFFSEAMVGGGYNSYDTSRAGLNGTARGSTDGAQFDAYYGIGYDKQVGPVTVSPIASVLYSVVGIDGFDETGSLEPLHIDAQSASSLRSRFGLRLTHADQLRTCRITSSVSAQWQHEFLDDELAFKSRFANGSGSPFTVHGPRIGGRDSALLTGSVSVAWSHYAVYLAYQADLGRENYENQTVLIGLRSEW